ncbi:MULTISPECIES: hypothetical protein [unclassified Clostridium]|uniref:hypothetical protein n=1 Tax=Clostridium TaxID=1485 RepID=UPI001C8B325F|nr:MULTISPECIES: hypothetical protein [unclassified Clostridium]MBX9136952.1 hypothetical protein [Clostridium sp. K12(2020)]MBX9143730.1 hypothetical protein [Clostridium sp. K13]MDU2291068.1 hypothetical protein [Clostridium celatum]
MDKNEKILLGAACFFAGAVAGFLIAPIKKGIYCGNNNGNNYMNKDEEENDELNELNEIDEIDKVLDEVNEAINNARKEKNEEVIDSEEK